MEPGKKNDYDYYKQIYVHFDMPEENHPSAAEGESPINHPDYEKPLSMSCYDQLRQVGNSKDIYLGNPKDIYLTFNTTSSQSAAGPAATSSQSAAGHATTSSQSAASPQSNNDGLDEMTSCFKDTLKLEDGETQIHFLDRHISDLEAHLEFARTKRDEVKAQDKAPLMYLRLGPKGEVMRCIASAQMLGPWPSQLPLGNILRPKMFSTEFGEVYGCVNCDTTFTGSPSLLVDLHRHQMLAHPSLPSVIHRQQSWPPAVAMATLFHNNTILVAYNFTYFPTMTHRAMLREYHDCFPPNGTSFTAWENFRGADSPQI